MELLHSILTMGSFSDQNSRPQKGRTAMITRSRAEGVQSRRTALWGGFTAACAAALCAGASSPSADPIGAAAATPPYVLTGSVSLPGGDKITSFDISFVNPVLNRYFLANRTSKALIGIDTTT